MVLECIGYLRTIFSCVRARACACACVCSCVCICKYSLHVHNNKDGEVLNDTPYVTHSSVLKVQVTLLAIPYIICIWCDGHTDRRIVQ